MLVDFCANRGHCKDMVVECSSEGFKFSITSLRTLRVIDLFRVNLERV